MAQSFLELSPEETQSLPIDRLSFLRLHYLVDTKLLTAGDLLTSGPQLGKPKQSVLYWSEALNWLVSKNLVAFGTPDYQSPQAILITRRGRQVLETGLGPIRAAERLDLDLHDRLERVKSQFLLGEFELAAFAALREVEIRVRELSGAENSLIGVKLMRDAFGQQGKLTDPDLDSGEQEAISHLFAGAIGTFKNPPSHRQVDYADPTEASEVVLLADLLMRLLDRVAARIGDSER